MKSQNWNMDNGTQWYPAAPGSRAAEILEAQQSSGCCCRKNCCCDMDKLCELLERAECAARKAEAAAERAECKARCAEEAAERAECAAKESCRCAERQSWPRNCRCGG